MSNNSLAIRLYSVADFAPLREFNVALVALVLLALIFFTETRLFLIHYPFTPTIIDTYEHGLKAKRIQDAIYQSALQKDPKLESQAKIQIHKELFGNGGEPKPGSPGDIQVRRIDAAIKELFNDAGLNPFWARFGLPDQIRAVIVPGWLLSEGNTGQCGITDNAWQTNSSYLGPPDGRPFLPDAITIRDTTEVAGRMTTDGRARIAINLQAFESNGRLKLTIFHEFLHVLGLPAYSPFFTLLNLQSDLAYVNEYPLAVNSGNMHFWKEQYRDWIVWLFIFGCCFGMFVAKASSREMTTLELLREKANGALNMLRAIPGHFK